MYAQENMNNEKKHIVSMRLTNNDRSNIQILSSRLYLRESALYRFAINSLLTRMTHLNDEDRSGSDLLPVFIELKDEINEHLKLKKQQLYKIINASNANPDKFVDMEDIELLVLPPHLMRKHLLLIDDAIAFKNKDINLWLKNYLTDKYDLNAIEENTSALSVVTDLDYI